MTAEQIYFEIEKELERAKAKFPGWPSLQPIHCAAIVAEEAGELVQAALQFEYEGGDKENMKSEAIQTAAMCIRFLENFDSYE